MIPTRTAEDLFAGWWQLIAALGAVPRTLVWDGEGAIGRWRGGRAELTGDCQAFRGVLGTKVIVLKPGEPEAQGHHRTGPRLPGALVPARPGVHRPRRTSTPSCRAGWRRSTPAAAGCWGAPRPTGSARTGQAMLALPPVAPAIGWRTSTRLARDHYVRLDSNDYSVHPAVIGRRIEVVADLDRVQVFCEGRSSPTTNGSGPGTRPSPTPTTVEAAEDAAPQPDRCAAAGARADDERSSSAR